MKKLVCLFAMFLFSHSCFSQAASNEGFVEYQNDGFTRNACYDYMTYMYGAYYLSGTAKNAHVLSMLGIGMSESEFSGIANGTMVKAKVVTADMPKLAKSLGSTAIIASMKKNNDDLSDYSAKLGKTAKICLAGLQKVIK